MKKGKDDNLNFNKETIIIKSSRTIAKKYLKI